MEKLEGGEVLSAGREVSGRGSHCGYGLGMHLGIGIEKGSLNKEMLTSLRVQDSKAEKNEDGEEDESKEEEEEEEEAEIVDPKDTFEEGECMF